jgi:aerobic C4-dicarboxylate transport protein
MSECRALTNFTGNAVATIVVSRWEGGLDRAQLDRVLHAAAAPPVAAAPVEAPAD